MKFSQLYLDFSQIFSSHHPTASMKFSEEPSKVGENKKETNEEEHSQILAQHPEHEKGTNEEEHICNIFDGKWTYNPTASPLYNWSKCPFLSDQVSCQRNGMADFEYESWSWEAKGCEIPR